MKFLKYLSVVTLLLTTQLSANEADIKCNHDGNQMEMNQCAYDDYEKADKALNNAYKELVKLKKGNKVYITKLKTSQRLWIKFRDAELETIFACEDGDMRMCWGSMYNLIYHVEMKELTDKRTATLKGYIKGFTNL